MKGVFIDLLYTIRMHEHTREWPPVSWKRTIVPKFSLSVSKPTNPFPLTFVFRCLLRKKYAPVVSFLHVDNTTAPLEKKKTHGEEQRARERGGHIESRRKRPYDSR